MELITVTEAQENFRYWNHNRDVPFPFLNCPIIVGRTKLNNLIILDGSHRLIKSIKENREYIPCFIVDVSFCDTVDDME